MEHPSFSSRRPAANGLPPVGLPELRGNSAGQEIPRAATDNMHSLSSLMTQGLGSTSPHATHNQSSYYPHMSGSWQQSNHAVGLANVGGSSLSNQAQMQPPPQAYQTPRQQMYSQTLSTYQSRSQDTASTATPVGSSQLNFNNEALQLPSLTQASTGSADSDGSAPGLGLGGSSAFSSHHHHHHQQQQQPASSSSLRSHSISSHGASPTQVSSSTAGSASSVDSYHRPQHQPTYQPFAGYSHPSSLRSPTAPSSSSAVSHGIAAVASQSHLVSSAGLGGPQGMPYRPPALSQGFQYGHSGMSHLDHGAGVLGHHHSGMGGYGGYQAQSPLYHHASQGFAASTKDRPFRCDQCTQAFNRGHDLKRHKRIHLAVKPFPCQNCDKRFSRKDALKRHCLVKGCSAKDDKNKRDADPLSSSPIRPRNEHHRPSESVSAETSPRTMHSHVQGGYQSHHQGPLAGP